MKILWFLKSTGLCLAIGLAGQAHASLIGSFSGNLGSVGAENSTTNGNLAADIAADSNAPFNLGTLFTGIFTLNTAAVDTDPSPSVGMYPNSLLSFSITGGDINATVSTGNVRISDNESSRGKFQDRIQIQAVGFAENFVINGNIWIFEAVRVIQNRLDTIPSSIFTDDGLQQHVTESAPWNYEQVVLSFSQQGVANSKHYARFGSGEPGSNLEFSLLDSPTPSAPVPATATLHLLIAALGLLGLRRRNRKKLNGTD
ncbi:MAG: hypothetical protein KC587_18480 [Nitrospira sp.]|nr:hypothetical protein [Nitrospira sp.]